jgi:hypothetical protein
METFDIGVKQAEAIFNNRLLAGYFTVQAVELFCSDMQFIAGTPDQ